MHYVAVNASTIREKAKWLAENDGAAQQIAANAFEWFRKHLRAKDVMVRAPVPSSLAGYSV